MPSRTAGGWRSASGICAASGRAARPATHARPRHRRPDGPLRCPVGRSGGPARRVAGARPAGGGAARGPSPTTPVPSAREAQPAAGDTRFVPERIELPGGAYTAVVPVATVGKELVVPEDPTKVGWWDGSSYVGDPYGSTVIAGHVDPSIAASGFSSDSGTSRSGSAWC